MLTGPANCDSFDSVARAEPVLTTFVASFGTCCEIVSFDDELMVKMRLAYVPPAKPDHANVARTSVKSILNS